MGEEQGLEALASVRVGRRFSMGPPRGEGPVSVERAIAQRRSVRDFSQRRPSMSEVSQLLWAAQGMTSGEGLRAAPSAGARYPLEVHLVCEQGMFRYRPRDHSVTKEKDGDLRQALADAAYGQVFIVDAPISVIFTAVYERTMSRYGERGVRYVHIDVGHAAQNVHLQAEALGLGSVPVGAFDDAAVAEALSLPAEEKPVYIVPVGRPARG